MYEVALFTHLIFLLVLSACFELNFSTSQKKRVPLGYWKDISNQRKFLESVATELNILAFSFLYEANIKEPRDWYFVSIKHIVERGGTGLLYHHNRSLMRALRAVYPDYSWNMSRFSYLSAAGRTMFSKVQYLLFQHVQRVSFASV